MYSECYPLLWPPATRWQPWECCWGANQSWGLTRTRCTPGVTCSVSGVPYLSLVPPLGMYFLRGIRGGTRSPTFGTVLGGSDPSSILLFFQPTSPSFLPQPTSNPPPTHLQPTSNPPPTHLPSISLSTYLSLGSQEPNCNLDITLTSAKGLTRGVSCGMVSLWPSWPWFECGCASVHSEQAPIDSVWVNWLVRSRRLACVFGRGPRRCRSSPERNSGRRTWVVLDRLEELVCHWN